MSDKFICPALRNQAAVRIAGTIACLLAGANWGLAQESPQAPLTPPPDHEVRRLSTKPEPPAPPSLPPEEIIHRFSQKEDQFLAVRPTYGYRKTLRIDEFGENGKLMGQYLLVTEVTRAANGQVISKIIEKPQSTLHTFTLEAEDVKELDRIPAFPLTSSQLSKYDLQYLGEEQVDEVDTYIFQVKPKTLERAKAYFDGIVWVDKQYLEVVKTYGKWVNELGDVHTPPMLPFTMYETYRENVDGKYWFPSYMRSDETIHLKDTNIPLRLVVKWTDFKPLPPAASPSSTSPTRPGLVDKDAGATDTSSTSSAAPVTAKP
jgi:hypothetical protein